jgi:hypothetical protein
VALLTASGAWICSRVPAPSSELLEGIVTIGIGLFVAYVLEMAWLVTRLRSATDYETRLGAFVGLGFAGLLGIVMALFLAAHRVAGHANLLDDIGFSWAIASLALLGVIVTLQPLLVHEWDSDEKDVD